MARRSIAHCRLLSVLFRRHESAREFPLILDPFRHVRQQIKVLSAIGGVNRKGLLTDLSILNG